jgi:hypothetical protein
VRRAVPWRSHRYPVRYWLPLEHRFLPSKPAPLCQEEVEISFLGKVFGLLEDVSREGDIGVEDLDADETDVLPV